MPGPIQQLKSSRQATTQIRRDARSAADVHVAGYVDSSAQQLAIPGDKEAPFSKAPPFPTPAAEIASFTETPVEHNPATSTIPLLDVEDAREINFTFEYTPAQDNATLSTIVYSVLPQQLEDFSDAIFVPLSFTSPTSSSSTAPAGYTQPFANIAVEPMVFNYVATTTDTIRFNLTVNVAGFSIVTLTVAEANEGEADPGTLRILASTNN